MIFRENATGSGALSYTVNRGNKYRLLEVRLHLGAVSADLGGLAVTLDSELGAAYDSVLAAPDPNEDLTAVTSWRYADPVPPVILPGDKVVISWANAGSKTWAIEVIGEE